MKKNLGIIVILILFVYLLFTNQSIISLNVLKVSRVFILKILPTILPLYIISKLLINYNLPYYIAKIFHNNLYVYIFIMGIISGCPNNIIMIKDLLNSGIINIQEANKYVTCSFFSNPLFLYSMLRNIFDLKITILIICTHYFANIIIYLFKPVKNNNIVKVNSQKFDKVFITAIKSSGAIMLNIYITIIIFNIIISLLPTIFNGFIGLFELTQGLDNLQYLNIEIFDKEILALIYTSFGGLSIIFQVISVLSDTKINSMQFVKARYLQVIISIGLFLLARVCFI